MEGKIAEGNPAAEGTERVSSRQVAAELHHVTISRELVT